MLLIDSLRFYLHMYHIDLPKSGRVRMPNLQISGHSTDRGNLTRSLRKRAKFPPTGCIIMSLFKVESRMNCDSVESRKKEHVE